MSSTLPLRLLIALTQAPADGLTLRELARGAGVSDSTTAYAIAGLVDDGLAMVTGRRGRRRYAPASSERAELMRTLALRTFGADDALAIAARANRAVEFASRDPQGLLVVYGDGSDPADAARFEEFPRAVSPAVVIEAQFHADLVRRLRTDRSPRSRALRGRVLKGRVDRSVPDRTRHRDFRRARRLRRPHPSLRVPSLRTLQRLAGEHGLRRVALFGSAVRSDFRPDSDVDVLVEYRPQAKRTVRSHLALKRSLERFFRHDVDLVNVKYLDPQVRPMAAREMVRLYGRA